MNTFELKYTKRVTKKELNNTGFTILLGNDRLRYVPCKSGFNVLRNGKFLHYVNNLYGDV
jgi:hypothetical protein